MAYLRYFGVYEYACQKCGHEWLTACPTWVYNAPACPRGEGCNTPKPYTCLRCGSKRTRRGCANCDRLNSCRSTVKEME